MISIIVAIAKNQVIGKAGDLPWKLSADLKHFAKVTKGHKVIMGRKTCDSIVKRLGHGLPERENIVITSQSNFNAPGCTIIQSVTAAVEMYEKSAEEVFVIGGGEIYRQFLPVAKKLYITEVQVECDGDTFFPPYANEDWVLVSSEHHDQDEKNSCPFTFQEFVRK
jgi:dihydrofolate reductase